jgi:hypothetical protein
LSPEGPVLAFKNMGKHLGRLVADTASAMVHERENETGRTSGKSGSVMELEWKKNALRHSFISYRVAAIQNVNQVALEAGNSAAMIFKHNGNWCGRRRRRSGSGFCRSGPRRPDEGLAMDAGTRPDFVLAVAEPSGTVHSFNALSRASRASA